MPDLRSLDLAELEARAAAAGLPRFRAEQVFRWLHGRQVDELEAMHNLPRDAALAMAAGDAVSTLTEDAVQLAADGTRKLRFRTADGRSIESVLIPDGDRARDKLTLCISSQVGCALDCRFCATATLGFGRNLTAGEIVEQVYRATRLGGRLPTNLVFMGMGEPLHNFEGVSRALHLLQHPWGAGLSARRITVSTAGLVPGIARLAALDPPPNLAISLNATTDEGRSALMPVNRKWGLAALLDAARAFPLGHNRRVTFEYVLLAGVNDSDADARRLRTLLAGMQCKVNLIPWNPFAGPAFRRPEADRIRSFQDTVRATGLPVYIRTPRGDDIDAACGQLAARGDPGAVVAAERLTART